MTQRRPTYMYMETHGETCKQRIVNAVIIMIIIIYLPKVVQQQLVTLQKTVGR